MGVVCALVRRGYAARDRRARAARPAALRSCGSARRPASTRRTRPARPRRSSAAAPPCSCSSTRVSAPSTPTASFPSSWIAPRRAKKPISPKTTARASSPTTPTRTNRWRTTSPISSTLESSQKRRVTAMSSWYAAMTTKTAPTMPTTARPHDCLDEALGQLLRRRRVARRVVEDGDREHGERRVRGAAAQGRDAVDRAVAARLGRAADRGLQEAPGRVAEQADDRQHEQQRGRTAGRRWSGTRPLARRLASGCPRRGGRRARR